MQFACQFPEWAQRAMSTPTMSHRSQSTVRQGPDTNGPYADDRRREETAGLPDRRTADRTRAPKRRHARDEPTVSVEHCTDATAGRIALEVAARHRPVGMDDDRPITVFDLHRVIVDCTEGRS